MLSRTVLTYALFRSVRGATAFCFDSIERIPEHMRLYECPRCGKWWSVDDEDDDLTCPYCKTLMKKRFKEYYFDQQRQRTNEDEY